MRGRLQNCMHRPPDRPPRHPQGRRGLQPRGRRRTNFRAVWGELQRVMTMRRSFSAESAPFAGGADPFMISSLLTSYYREVWGQYDDFAWGLPEFTSTYHLSVSNTWTDQFCAKNVYTFLRQKAFHPQLWQQSLLLVQVGVEEAVLKRKGNWLHGFAKWRDISNAKCSLNSSSHSFI